ncbi:putative acetyltransferase [Anaerovirgula multivorans]|uniref:Putative acetyltransferase n=1 Tax=Anaerovirgula multivorans TaxID=312168 RepID=A0A239D9A6_9FIRM|nr:N-acetyltransferase [Anaerovirgula multivorans]SNS28451.1 putative acetyltransferase [Anaerovirgula multivorans]
MIRKLNVNEQEINKIMEIWRESTIEAHRFISQEYWLKSYEVVKEKYLPMAETYVYLDENEIKGFISILQGEHIGALFIDINCQGKGIGKKLIEHIKEIYDSLTLAVYKENKKAVNFYEKVGFIKKYEKLNEETNESEYSMSFEKH